MADAWSLPGWTAQDPWPQDPTEPAPPTLLIPKATFTGRYADEDGKPLSGYVKFSPSERRIVFSGYVVRLDDVKVDLDEDGMFSVEVVASDNTVVQPTGWFYRVTEYVAGVKKTYDIAAVAD